MPTLAEKAGRAMTPSTRVLDPVERASEAIFGVLMAVSIMGALSVTSGGPMDARAPLLMAIGCNIAWGFTDAVMYLVSTATVNSRNLRLVRRLQTTTDIREARLIVADALPERVAAICRKVSAVHTLVAEAAATGDRKLVEEAVRADPAVADKAAGLSAIRELIEAHRDVLPQFH